MSAKWAFPRDLSEDASTEELRAYLGDLCEWLSRKRRRDLMAAGFSESDLFEFRRVGHAYRTDALTPTVLAKAATLFAKLEMLHV